MFGAELKVKRMVVPYTASVNCAFGLVSADIAHEYSTTTLLPVPSPAEVVNDIYEPMIARALRQLKEEGFEGKRVRLEWSIDLRYSRQVHEVTTPVRAPAPITEQGLAQLVSRFRGALRAQIRQGFRLSRSGDGDDHVSPDCARLDGAAEARAARARQGPIRRRRASDGGRSSSMRRNGMADADIYDFERLVPGNVVPGPAVIHTPITTIVLQAGTARHDGRLSQHSRRLRWHLDARR